MPQPVLPPTPAASLDITGKQAHIDGPHITLGPAAVPDSHSERSVSATPSADDSESSYNPTASNSATIGKRKQSSKFGNAREDFALPPPPSRSRKIIQMKPKVDELVDDSPSQAAGATTTASTTTKGSRKRGSNTNTTAAGRKIARKTAHSLIERRRRSKMNEEFGVLKDMIPACAGHEMHKLAILQASIDYLRYLEKCIDDLKSNNPRARPPPSAPSSMDLDTEVPDISEPAASESSSVPATRPPTATSFHISSPTSQTPQYPVQLPPLSYIASTSNDSSRSNHPSPSFRPQDSTTTRPVPRQRQASTSSSVANFSPYILPQSTSTSPVFSPVNKSGQSNRNSIGRPPSSTTLSAIAGEAMSRFSLTSPALTPIDARGGSNSNHNGAGSITGATSMSSNGQSERSDREAMAALLMLNNDRRGSLVGSPVVAPEPASKVARRAGAMSVRDLLSPE